MRSHVAFKDFDTEYGFSDKAGFVLTKLQAQDAEQFVHWPSGLLSYDVGGGKTVVSTVVALMRGSDQNLVIVPPILITPWAAWLNKVSTDVLVYRGSPAVRYKMNLSSARWVVCSHSIFREDFDRLHAELSPNTELIVDEAHGLKNSGSKLFKCVRRFVSNA
jgi:superfamily II DNA or RNA helicase